MIGWVFPGQGSQAAGMADGLFQRFPRLVEEADDILGYSIRALCIEDSQGQLAHTAYAQPAIYVSNALHLADHRQRGEAEPDFCAGHSLGEYSALYAAGAFDFGVGLRLVRRRGELFEQCNELGGMAAVVGLTPARIRTVLREHGLAGVDLANLNSTLQTVIAGPRPELERAGAALEKAGCAAFRPLPVSGAFHSRYMAAIKPAFAAALAEVVFEPLRVPVIANVTARPYRCAMTAEYLLEQVDHPVRWGESVRHLMSRNVAQFIEIGHGSILTRLHSAIKSDQHLTASAERLERAHA